MANQTRQMVKIIHEICSEHKIEIKSFSHEWILQLNANNRMMLIYGYRFPNNNAAIEQICNDKAALSNILEAHKIAHVPHHLFFSPMQTQYVSAAGNWSEMQKLLQQYKTIICKTNNGTGGKDVYKVSSNKELEFSTHIIFSKSRTLSISPYRNIRAEYRVIIVNSNVGIIYEKRRPTVIGNGIDSIQHLIEQDSSLYDIEIDKELDTLRIPAKSEIVEISWKHNLGQGAHPEIVTDPQKQKELTELALSCSVLLDANFMSIDIVDDECGLEVLEINSGVMMENLAKESSQYYAMAKSVYEKAILRYLGMDLPKYKAQKHEKKHFVLPVLEEIANERGVRIIPDNEEGNFSIFVFKNGKRFVAKDYPFNINYAGSISLCTNKAACACFLQNMGFRTPMQKSFIKEADPNITLAELQKHFTDSEKLLGFGFPMIIKPNSLSQGMGVYKIDNPYDGSVAAKKILSLKENCILLQAYCSGRDFRIVVLNNQVIQAYERIPFHIVGDGRNTIKSLLQNQVMLFEELGRDKKIDISDSRILHNIYGYGYTLDTILAPGVTCQLQNIANLSLGGTTKDCTNCITSFYSDLAIHIADSMNLKLCGIDLIAKDITAEENNDYYILEVNSAPGLDNYAFEGKKQEEYVKRLYRKVFDYLESIE